MIVYLSLFVCIVGALIYGYAANEKLKKLGGDMFWCGLLAFLLMFRGASSLNLFR